MGTRTSGRPGASGVGDHGSEVSGRAGMFGAVCKASRNVLEPPIMITNVKQMLQAANEVVPPLPCSRTTSVPIVRR